MNAPDVDINTVLLAALVAQLQRLIPRVDRLLRHFGIGNEPPAPPAPSSRTVAGELDAK